MDRCSKLAFPRDKANDVDYFTEHVRAYRGGTGL